MRPIPRRPVPHPGQFKKRSDYASLYETPVNVSRVGEEQLTEAGSKAEGYKGEFEIVYELVAKQARTAQLVHAKKERVVKILGGSGILALTVDGKTTEQRLRTGDDLILAAGVTHAFTATTPLNLMFIQPKAYEARVQVLSEPIFSTIPVAPVSQEPEFEAIPPRRGGNMAAIQQERIANERDARRGIAVDRAASSPPRVPGSIGPMPSYGNDLPGEAG